MSTSPTTPIRIPASPTTPVRVPTSPASPVRLVPLRRRSWPLLVATIAVWLGVGVVLVVSYLATRQPALEPITIGG